MVWVIGADDKVSPQPVTLGDQIGNNYLVEAGLKGGERIITEGIIKVRPGMTVRVRGEATATAAVVDKEPRS